MGKIFFGQRYSETMSLTRSQKFAQKLLSSRSFLPKQEDEVITNPWMFLTKGAGKELPVSGFFAALLDPRKSYGQYDLFLKHVLANALGEDFSSRVDSASVKVIHEHERRDIVVMGKFVENSDLIFSDEFRVTFEVKVNAGESHDRNGRSQLANYPGFDRTNPKLQDTDCRYIYLTLDGRPVTGSENVGNWQLQGFSEWLAPLDSAIERTFGIPEWQRSLRHFKEHLEWLMWRNDVTKKEIELRSRFLESPQLERFLISRDIPGFINEISRCALHLGLESIDSMRDHFKFNLFDFDYIFPDGTDEASVAEETWREIVAEFSLVDETSERIAADLLRVYIIDLWRAFKGYLREGVSYFLAPSLELVIEKSGIEARDFLKDLIVSLNRMSPDESIFVVGVQLAGVRDPKRKLEWTVRVRSVEAVHKSDGDRVGMLYFGRNAEIMYKNKSSEIRGSRSFSSIEEFADFIINDGINLLRSH